MDAGKLMRRPFQLRSDPSWPGLSGECGEKCLGSQHISVISINIKCKRNRDFNIWTSNWSRIEFSLVEVERTIGGTCLRDRTQGCV